MPSPLYLPRGVPLREARVALTAYLTSCDVDSPGLSARLLIQQALGADERVHFLQPERLFADGELADLMDLAERRGRGEPMAYISGHKEFYGYDIAVGPGCLIPRPETEQLVEWALAAYPPGSPCRFVDCGTGSGCISVAFALEQWAAQGLALDCSPQALPWARKNLSAYGLQERVMLVQGNFAAIPLPSSSVDLVLANPPYVSPSEYETLDSEVKDYEPLAALVPFNPPASDIGLAALKRLAPEAARVLNPGGYILCEIGWKQGEKAIEILEYFPEAWCEMAILQDLAGRDRVLKAKRKG